MKTIAIKVVIATVLTFFAHTGLWAQQIPMYAGYMVNRFLVSPSFAGTDESDLRLMALNRLQFAGIEGAPVTFMATGDGAIKKKNMGLGATVYSDKYGLLRQTGAGLGYSYKIGLGASTSLHFGLAGEIGQLSLDFDQVQAHDATDEKLLSGRGTKVNVNGSFGMHLKHEDFTIGFAAPQVFGRRVTYQDYVSDTETGYEMKRHFVALMGYRFNVKPGVVDIEPVVLMRMISGLGPQFDVNIRSTIRNNVFLSVGYRSDYALSFGGGLNVSENLMLGYSYDLAINEIAGYSFGSHEFMLAYRYYKGMDRRDVAEKLQEEREMERKRAEDVYGGRIETLEADLGEQSEMNRMQREEIEKLRKVIEGYGLELDSLKRANAERVIKDAEGYDVNGDGAVDALDDTNGDGVIDEADFIRDAKGNLVVPAKIVRQGGPASGGVSGKYLVVIASFKSMANAMEYQQVLKRAGDSEATYLAQSASEAWYFVYKKGFDDAAAAQAYLNELSREGLEEFMYPWIYVRK